MARFMADHDLDSSPVTTSDGRLVGLLLRRDATRVADELAKGERPGSTTGMSEAPLAVRPCSRCGRLVDCCEFCDDADCRTPTCYGCVQVVLGQALQQPHAHGG
jgi:hypothetical protein